MSIRNVSGTLQALDQRDAKGWLEKTDFKLNTSLSLDDGPAINTQDMSFSQYLAKSIGEVNEMQVKANKAMEALASGDGSNLHETMLMVEQADMAFKSMNQIRLKVLDAYRDIMKMQM